MPALATFTTAEMETTWTKSSLSFSNGNCVEVGCAPGMVGVRDTKDRGGPVLTFAAKDWERFVAGLKADGRGTLGPWISPRR